MKEGEGTLSVGGGIFLLFVGIIIDLLQFGCSLILIGFIVNPFILTPLAWFIFWLVLHHYDIPMLSGKRAFAGWLAVLAELIPEADGFVPGWTVYAIYLMVAPKVSSFVQSILSR